MVIEGFSYPFNKSECLLTVYAESSTDPGRRTTGAVLHLDKNENKSFIFKDG
jgi:hypothetical protein